MAKPIKTKLPRINPRQQPTDHKWDALMNKTLKHLDTDDFFAFWEGIDALNVYAKHTEE